MKWQLWVDYQRTDERGLTHASSADAETGATLAPGEFVVVGNEDADIKRCDEVRV